MFRMKISVLHFHMWVIDYLFKNNIRITNLKLHLITPLVYIMFYNKYNKKLFYNHSITFNNYGLWFKDSYMRLFIYGKENIPYNSHAINFQSLEVMKKTLDFLYIDEEIEYIKQLLLRFNAYNTKELITFYQFIIKDFDNPKENTILNVKDYELIENKYINNFDNLLFIHKQDKGIK